MPLENFEIGSTTSTTNVEDLGTPLPPPRSTWNDYSQSLDLADGSVRGAGWAVATWTWDFLTQAQRTQLRSFCSGKSATVYIRTKLNDETFGYYLGVMVWPDGPEARGAGVVQNLTVEFRALESFTP